MMMQQLQASILSAPLAQIDRRSLSQAWYSALNLARARQSSKPSKTLPAASSRQPGRCVRTGDASRRVHSSPLARAPVRAAGPRAVLLERFVERRAPRSPLARRIESVFLDPRSQVERSTFTIGRGGARVHVVLQSRGVCVRLIAICAPAHRETVARALAQARFALASRGYVGEHRTQGEVPWS